MIMQTKFLKQALIMAFTVFTACYAGIGSAHTAGATLGPERSFTGVALITCFDDAGEVADSLIARIRDDSPSVPGLLVNLQIFKNGKSISITDTVSGDASYSPFIKLQGGGGVYWIWVNKTDEGERRFVLDYHCNAANDSHVGTDIDVTQFGLP